MSEHDPRFAELRGVCRSVASSLSDLAYSFEDVGNAMVADRLRLMAERLVASSEDAWRERGQRLTDDLNQAREFSGLLLKAAVDGCLQPAKKAKP